VWLEGNGQVAAALLDRSAPGDLTAALDLINTAAIGQAELGAEQTIADQPVPPGAGVVAASSPLHAGTEDTGYYPCRHVGATAWFILAATSTNPYSADFSSTNPYNANTGPSSTNPHTTNTGSSSTNPYSTGFHSTNWYNASTSLGNADSSSTPTAGIHSANPHGAGCQSMERQ
jgi:hypothetical protein